MNFRPLEKTATMRVTMSLLKRTLTSFILIGMVSACSSSSQITAAWKNEKALTGYDEILVAAITKSVEAKSTIEASLAESLSSKGITVTKSIDAFPPKISGNPTKDDMLNKIRKNGKDAILTVTLVDKQTQSRYVPGSVGYAPIPVYGRFGGYYNYWVPQQYAPDYYVHDKIYYMETNVYDAKTEELVWSAETETLNPDNLSGFSQELANILANKLEKDGIIGKKKMIQPDKKAVSKR